MTAVVLAAVKKTFRLLASLKIAIPLLVVLTIVTIVGSLFPDPAFFSSWWYLTLLGLQGLSLLLVTIQQAPSVLRRKGRNALIGVITTHLGILVLIGGIIYGGFSGFRYELKIIEGEATVVPGLPFAIQLEKLHVEEYRQEDFPRLDLSVLPKKRQDSEIVLLVGGKLWRSLVAAPGKPAQVDGITLLPTVSDTGWYFELIVTDVRGREKTIPVRPWAPPLITIGGKRLMTHNLVTGDQPEAEFFVIEDEAMKPVGVLRQGESLEIEHSSLSFGAIKRYTGIKVYSRPQEWILVLGSVLMFVGLVWHFYFRHRDRSRSGRE
jgi:cytochrome c biogenesis protein ResB